MDTLHIRNIMTPIDQFPRISHNATFYEALLALEKAQEEFLAGRAEQRILVVKDDRGEVVGKLSPMDLLRGLEPNYGKIDESDLSSRFGLSYVIKSMKDELRLWQKPLGDLCRKAQDLKVGSIVKVPVPGRKVSIKDSMDEAFHRFIMGGHDSLFVMDGDRIIGLLRFSDVHRAISQTIKACKINSQEDK